MLKIIPPTNCPACDSLLENVNGILYCRNSECGQQARKKVEHFAKTMKIKGLGPSSISKLDFASIEDIYKASRQELEGGLSSAKLAEKLYLEIEKSKTIPMNTLLASFSIPLIGTTAARKLSEHCTHISEIDESLCLKAGLGPKATDNLLQWLNNTYPKLASLPLNFNFEKEAKVADVKGVVCISGKLKSYATKAIATEVLTKAGYIVKPSLTKEVTILINESEVQETSKTKKARESGVLIVNNIGDLIK